MNAKPGSFLHTLFLGALSAIPPISIDMALPALLAMENAYPGAEMKGALTLSLFLAGFAIAPLVAGALADRFGRRPLVLWGLATMSASAMACALAPNFNFLLACRLVQGLGAGVCVVMPIAIVRDHFEGKAAQVKLSQMVAVLGVAPIVAPSLGAWVLTHTSWRSIFLLQATLSLLLAMAIRSCMPESLKPEHRQPLDPRGLLRAHRIVLSNPSFRNFALMLAFAFATIFVYISGSSAMFMGALGLPPATFSQMFGLTAGGLVAGSVVGVLLAERGVSSSSLLKAGLLGMVLLTAILLALALARQRQAWVLVLLFGMILVAFGLAAPSLTHEAMQPVPQRAGAAAGMLRSLQMGMGALASGLVAVVIPMRQPVVAVAGLMLAFAAGAAMLLLFKQRGPKVSEPSFPKGPCG